MKSNLLFIRPLAAIFSVFCLASCSEMKEENAIETVSKKESKTIVSEMAYPGETGVEKTGRLFGQDITYTDINGEAVFEGDIILSKEQLNAGTGARTEATGVSLEAQRWANGIVYYTFDKTLTNTSAISAAMSLIESSTPIKFVYRSTEYNYVTFKFGRGFSSSIGVTGGQQFIYLGLGFDMGGALHEIGHTLGLFHEHTRTDRDKTININYQNITTSLHSYFKTYAQSGSAGFDFDTMDLTSVMMMDSYYYSNNGLPSMTTKDGQPFSIQRTKLSESDTRCLTAMYSNIYSITSDYLYAADTRKGKRGLLSKNWAFTKAMTADPNFIYAAKSGSLLRINPLNADTKVIATGFWDVQAMVLLKGFLYVINDGVLTKVNMETGAQTKIGSQIWLPATDLTYMNGFFYLMTKNAIFRVTPETGIYTQIAAVADAKELVALGGNLYYVKTKPGKTYGIYKLNPSVGVAFLFSSLFSPNAQMTSSGGNLYVADLGYLYKIEANGSNSTISFGWSFTTQLVALNPYNY